MTDRVEGADQYTEIFENLSQRNTPPQFIARQYPDRYFEAGVEGYGYVLVPDRVFYAETESSSATLYGPGEDPKRYGWNNEFAGDYRNTGLRKVVIKKEVPEEDLDEALKFSQKVRSEWEKLRRR